MPTAYHSSVGIQRTNYTDETFLSMTVPSGLVKPILFFVFDHWSAFGDPGGTDEVSWNGKLMTRLFDAEQSGYHRFNLAYLVNPAPGTFNLYARSALSSNCNAAAVLFTGVDQVNPIAQAVSGTTLSTNLTTLIGQHILDILTEDGEYSTPSPVSPTFLLVRDSTNMGSLGVGYQVAESLSPICAWTSPTGFIKHKSVVLNYDSSPVVFVPKIMMF